MSKRNKKQSAIERELNVVIVLNNLKTESEVESESETETDDLSEPFNKAYRVEKQLVPKSKKSSITDIRANLAKDTQNAFIVKDRQINISDSDLFNILLDRTNTFCKLPTSYLKKSINESDFVIFINNGSISSGYNPMCIAFIELFKNQDNNFLYIYTICSDPAFGQCGTFLMNTIKYLSTLFNCTEIRLSSVGIRNTLDFYKRNGFINHFNSPVDYSHYYHIMPDDAEYKRPNQIEGNIRIDHPSAQWFYTNGLVKYNSKNKSKRKAKSLNTVRRKRSNKSKTTRKTKSV
jgi:hypothetical protein